jgi:membrane-bound inhibitor of C-type lysozyme
MRRAGALLALSLATPAAALDVASLHYLCERGVVIPATYATAASGAAVVLHVDDRQIALMQVPAASGVRYEGPLGDGAYVWHTRGTEARLDWRGSEGELVLFEACTSE